MDILKAFHSFCVENKIKYYLSHGTLLGAIRYKKFIPWDDDIDVLVPRADYDRLISLFQDNERYHLYAFEKNKKYLYPFAKLCDMTTRKEENAYKSEVELGVEIDIFPLDAYDNDFGKAKKEVKYIQKNGMWLRLAKLKKPETNNLIKYTVWSILIALAKTLGGGFFIKRIIRESDKPEQKGSRYLGAKVWSMYGERDIVPAEAFSVPIEIEFENEKFFAPEGYDTYLTCLYGDYLPEPPKEKQKTHHSFKAYRL